MVWFELDRDEWTGPIRGPLWCAVTWLQPALTRGDEEPEQIADALDYLTRLGLHVVPQPERLAAWLRAVLPRLATHSPPNRKSSSMILSRTIPANAGAS